MDFDEALTDLAGVMIILIGLVSLSEALLRIELVGDGLPLVQGAFVSLFAVGFGAVLLTEDASRAFRVFRESCADLVRR